MSGLGETFDRALVARVVVALMRLDRATRTKSGLSNRADIARMTLNRVLAGSNVRDDTYGNLDEGLLLPAGTLEAVGNRDQAGLDSLDVPAKLMNVIAREMADHSKGPARNRRVM